MAGNPHRQSMGVEDNRFVRLVACLRGQSAKRGAAWLTGVVALNITTLLVVGDVQISRSTIDGGGVMRSTGNNFELSGTIGQPDAGVLAGGPFELSGGFWFPLAPGDCDSDGVTDLIDFQAFQTCLDGPDSGVTSGCACFDLDQDRDIDLTDVAAFQTHFAAP